MTDFMCRYSGDRDQTVVSYLYEEIVPAERAAFEAHLPACDRCRAELAAFKGVRASLGRWSPPEPAHVATSHQPPATSRSWWREIPAWAQVAAALLVLGVAAGLANLDVRYDANGFRVRTGWLATASAPVGNVGNIGNVGSPGSVGNAGNVGGSVPWRADLTALEERLRSDLRQPDRPATNVANSANSVNTETLRRVRTLLDESERRQQRELALRLAGAMRDVNAQRQADLVKIDRSIGAMQNDTGLAIMRTRETINNINNYVRTSSLQRPQ